MSLARQTTMVSLPLVLAWALAARAQPSVPRADFTSRLVAAAVERASVSVRYVPRYVPIPYPGGDVPTDTGVCADEIIRIYRKVGIDLQKEVHEDMVREHGAYPKKWLPQKKPDSNIDHRRVPNLMVFFRRHGEALPITTSADDYRAGDVVSWELSHGLTHIGMVVDQKALLSRRRLILHNIGQGPKLEDVLFDWPITGHYRYFGSSKPR